MSKLDRVGRHLEPQGTFMNHATTMSLDNFSVSLVVKALAASHAFYQALRFVILGGDAAQNWLTLQNGGTTIGLFQHMFKRNVLPFNPSWDGACNARPEFADVRELQRRLRGGGYATWHHIRCNHHRPGQLHRHRPRLQPDPDRPARALSLMGQ